MARKDDFIRTSRIDKTYLPFNTQLSHHLIIPCSRELADGIDARGELAKGEEYPRGELAYRETARYELPQREQQPDPELRYRYDADPELADRDDSPRDAEHPILQVPPERYMDEGDSGYIRPALPFIPHPPPPRTTG
jgi:hypothetical protein